MHWWSTIGRMNQEVVKMIVGQKTTVVWMLPVENGKAYDIKQIIFYIVS